MKTTIYELLGMIKDGKAPKKIKYGNNIYTYQEHIADYSVEDDMDLFDGGINTFMLNDEVEILDEEDKIIQLPIIQEDDLFDTRLIINQNRRKINEIIDKLNGDKENENIKS